MIVMMPKWSLRWEAHFQVYLYTQHLEIQARSLPLHPNINGSNSPQTLNHRCFNVIFSFCCLFSFVSRDLQKSLNCSHENLRVPPTPNASPLLKQGPNKMVAIHNLFILRPAKFPWEMSRPIFAHESNPPTGPESHQYLVPFPKTAPDLQVLKSKNLLVSQSAPRSNRPTPHTVESLKGVKVDEVKRGDKVEV